MQLLQTATICVIALMALIQIYEFKPHRLSELTNRKNENESIATGEDLLDLSLHESKEEISPEIKIMNGIMKREHTSKFKLAEDTKMLFVHVGKTGGRSVMCELGYGWFQYDLLCTKYTPAPSALKDASVGRTHMGCSNFYISRKFNTLVFILRNPIDRFISYFHYERPLNRSYARRSKCSNALHQWQNSPNGCFANITAFAESLILPKQGKNLTFCQELAWNVTHGTVQCRFHNHYNFAFYHEFVNHNRKIRVALAPFQNQTKFHTMSLRTEYLAHDWDTLNEALPMHNVSDKNGSSRFDTLNEKQVSRGFTKSGREDETSNALSLSQRKKLCRALCLEIQIYKSLLYKSQNLWDSQRKESIQPLIDYCPNEGFHVQPCTDYFGNGGFFSPFHNAYLNVSFFNNSVVFHVEDKK